MVNLTDVDLNKSGEYVSYLSRTLTDEIVKFLNNQGIMVSVRWISLLILFVSLGLIFIAMHISKPLIRWILIILGILLIGGLLIPW